MNILVTGAGGFIGQRLVGRLLAAGAVVIGLDRDGSAIPTGAVPVAGDMAEPAVRAAALDRPLGAIVHLASVPGGAAETDPASSRRINLDASLDLLIEAEQRHRGIRFVHVSTIAVLGAPLPARIEATPLSPTMLYGGHKAMFETIIAFYGNCGTIDGVSLRLPGILARPHPSAGLKSGFLSDMFHALRAREAWTCPLAPDVTVWVQSLVCCVDNLVAATLHSLPPLPPSRAVTMPLLRVPIGELVAEVAKQCDADPALATFAPSADAMRIFAARRAQDGPAYRPAWGVSADKDLTDLVRSALSTLDG